MPRAKKKLDTLATNQVGESSTMKEIQNEEMQVMEIKEDLANTSTTEQTTENEQEVKTIPSGSTFEISGFMIDPPTISNKPPHLISRRQERLKILKGKSTNSPHTLQRIIGETKKLTLESVLYTSFGEMDRIYRSTQVKNHLSTDSWKSLSLSAKTIQKLKNPNVEILNPTKIQRKFLPVLFNGRDVIVQSDFESGKTFGSLLYCGEKIRSSQQPNDFRALFLTASYETKKQAKEVGRFFFTAQGIVFHPFDLVDLEKLPPLDLLVLDNADLLFQLYPKKLNYVFEHIKYNQIAILTTRMTAQIAKMKQNGIGDHKFKFITDDSQPKSIPQSYHILPNYSSFITTMLFYFTTHTTKNFFVLLPTKNLALTYYYIFESILSSSVVGFVDVDFPTFDKRILFSHFLSMRTPEKFDMIITVGCPTDIVDYLYRVEYSSNPHAQSVLLLHDQVDDLRILKKLKKDFRQLLKKEEDPPQIIINTTLSTEALKVVAAFPQNVFFGVVSHRQSLENLNLNYYSVIEQSLLELPKYFNVEPNKIPEILLSSTPSISISLKDALQKKELHNPKKTKKKNKNKNKGKGKRIQNNRSQPKKVSKQQEKRKNKVEKK